MPKDRDKRGRVTPKKGTPPPSSPKPGRPVPARTGRRSILPSRIGPFDRPDKDAPLGEVGRRPSSPTKLFVYFVVYFACGVASFFVIKGSTGTIVGVVMIGISVLWLRGAATATARIQKRSRDEE